MKNSKRRIRLFKFYNEVGEKYPGSKLIYQWGPAKARARFLRGLLAEDPEALTLDLGCGDGYFRPYIKKYVGLDISRGYLKRFKGQRIQGVAQHLPFADKVFKRIFMSEMLEHTHERKMILDECYRILKVEGTLILSVPFGSHPKSPFKKKVCWDQLKKYGIAFCPYIHGNFSVKYTRKLLVTSKFHITRLKTLMRKGKGRFIVTVARRRV